MVIAAPKLQTVQLENTLITDEALVHLGKALQLKRVFLTGTAVTKIGVDVFAAAMPGCVVNWSPPEPLAPN